MSRHPMSPDQASPDHAEFALWDASYVLGALTPGDRRAYEEHLDGCERCRAAVAELAAMPGLLARSRPEVEGWDDQEPDAGPPANLVDLVTRRRELRARALRRRVVGAVVGVAAAAALAMAVPVALSRSEQTGVSQAVVLAPVGATTMTAALDLTSVAWGTSISMSCDYPTGEDWGGAYHPATYTLEITDTDGTVSDVATWSAVPGKSIHVDAATAVPLDHIASVTVLSDTGAPLLSAPVFG